MKYILSGNEQEVDKVLRENRIRVARGLINFEPVLAGTDDDTKEPSFDSKEPDANDVKSPKRKAKK